MDDITFWTYVVFLALTCLCALLQVKVNQTKSSVLTTSSPNFVALQRKFYFAYFLALISDWLQGPYVYKLYSSYGFVESQIALLYVMGFASSALFGTFTGILADRCGRRKTSVAFCVIYAVCCLTKISPNFYVLLVGRILGGVATSMLFSTFESWYVYEHKERHEFPAEWMSVTFSRATFWNGVLAIVSGVVANTFAEFFDYGPVAPFLLAVPVLILCLFVICKTWEENFGSCQDHFARSCMDGVHQIFSDKLILMLGMIQSLFECVMYMFVFVWTPILDAGGGTPLGIVFACFMVCIMIGSSLYQMASSVPYSPETILKWSLGLGFLSMGTCFLATMTAIPFIPMVYAAFLVLEVSIGIYFPTMSYLRSKIIPESHRASIMNWFRLPMNAITCGGLLWLHRKNSGNGNHQIFTISLAMIALAFGISVTFSQKIRLRATSMSDSEDQH